MLCMDSDFVIDFFRGKENAVARMERVKDFPLAIAAVTAYEVLYGFFRKGDNKKAEAAMEFFSSINILDTNLESALKASQIAGELAGKGQMINEFDSLIAGAMLAKGCKSILTSNVKDFGKIKNLTVLSSQ